MSLTYVFTPDKNPNARSDEQWNKNDSLNYYPLAMVETEALKFLASVQPQAKLLNWGNNKKKKKEKRKWKIED